MTRTSRIRLKQELSDPGTKAHRNRHIRYHVLATVLTLCSILWLMYAAGVKETVSMKWRVWVAVAEQDVLWFVGALSAHESVAAASCAVAVGRRDIMVWGAQLKSSSFLLPVTTHLMTRQRRREVFPNFSTTLPFDSNCSTFTLNLGVYVCVLLRVFPSLPSVTFRVPL